jgi:hypothetical protein
MTEAQARALAAELDQRGFDRNDIDDIIDCVEFVLFEEA